MINLNTLNLALNIHRQKEARIANRRLVKKRVQYLNEVLYFVSTSVPADSLVLQNPILRQAVKPYLLYYETFNS